MERRTIKHALVLLRNKIQYYPCLLPFPKLSGTFIWTLHISMIWIFNVRCIRRLLLIIHVYFEIKIVFHFNLQVTFLMMPLEIAWAMTVSWWAGDFICRLCSFFRIFGLFLSSNIVVCISIDRWAEKKKFDRVIRPKPDDWMNKNQRTKKYDWTENWKNSRPNY